VTLLFRSAAKMVRKWQNLQEIYIFLPGFGIELKRHFRNDLSSFGYNDGSLLTTLFSGPMK